MTTCSTRAGGEGDDLEGDDPEGDDPTFPSRRASRSLCPIIIPIQGIKTGVIVREVYGVYFIKVVKFQLN